jgi:hypothetical protein
MNVTSKDQVKRQKPIVDLNAKKGIETVDELADHLYAAAQVELSTIPLYLFSLYSIRVSGHSQWSAPRGVLRSMTGIAIEEMLHLALVRNLMVAIGRGDDITFYDPLFMPYYPSQMLQRHNPRDTGGEEIWLELKRLSKSHVSTFRRIEMPDDVDMSRTTFSAHPEDDGQYTSLGEFYRAIELGFEKLDGDIPWDLANVRKQYSRGFWNEFGHGKPVRVHDLATAKKALNLIIEQGEGSAKDRKRIPIGTGMEDFTHYEKFLRIERGEEGIGTGNGSPDQDISIDHPDATWPVVPNPSIDDFKDRAGIRALMELFNAAYCYTLCLLDETYQHSTQDVREEEVYRSPDGQAVRTEQFSRRYGLERNGIAAMQGILYPIAQTLVSTPIDPRDPDGMHAAPSFEYYDFGDGTPKKQRLEHLCDEAIRHFPSLGGPDGVRRQISLLAEV